MKKVAWRSPSNIALVKYWGKRGVQIPQNPSLSFTLESSFSEMQINFAAQDGFDLDFYFEGKANEKFKNKIALFLKSIEGDYPFLKNIYLQIHSSNSFPHSAGIASSASSMSALALCICSISEAFGEKLKKETFFQKASFLARLASGSACRSVYGGAVVWGSTSALPASSDEYAVPLPFEMHPFFQAYKDTILIVSASEKSVSSRAGHALMNTHPFAQVRYQQANENLLRLVEILKNGDVENFIRIVENEALTLHGLMMNSEPSFILMHPNTLKIIELIRDFRKQTAIPVCFTLDAGPNIHLLYPEKETIAVQKWISEELVNFCENGYYIHDRIGRGAMLIQ
ncbi:MAG: diphosphomevalonate decarboxylase [Cytophagales bacterium]|nr:MAG: diphosphomevalonate decarboxylase [Cytophagales bacterium]